MGCMNSLAMQAGICLAPWKRRVGAEWSCFTSERYLSSHLWCLALMQARSLNCCTPKSPFWKASLWAAQAVQLVLSWVVAKCICEVVHKMQWSFQAPDFFFQANLSYGYPTNHVQIVFSLFFLEARSWTCVWYFLRLWAGALPSLCYHLSWGLLPLIYC